jgi:hypothetical protein
VAGEEQLHPKTMYTNTGYEYWGRAAALIHISVDGWRDVAPLETERIYHLASGQHFVGRPGRRPIAGSAEAGTPAFEGNPLDSLVTLRALLVGLVEWVESDVEPPASASPRLADGGLVPLEDWRFPGIRGVPAPAVAHEAYRADYGARFAGRGIVANQPPRLGPAFPTRVPAVNALGNEIAGVQAIELLAPLATYTPWSLRRGRAGPQDELNDFVGLFVPLALTEADRARTGDPRPSVESLYSSRRAFVARARTGAIRLMAAGFMLPEDVGPALARMERVWDELHAGAP